MEKNENSRKHHNSNRINSIHSCRMQSGQHRAIWNSSIDSGTGRNHNSVPWVQIGGDSRKNMQENEELETSAQETQESEDVVRQSAVDYLKEILGKEYWKIWRN